jgi:hypothetical protein
MTPASIAASYNPTSNDRKVWVKKKNGDLVGGNYVVPKGNFARFLGYAKPNAEEKSGQGKSTASRVIEMALHNEFNDLGKKAMQRGMAYRNMYISMGKYSNQPGRERDMLKDGMDSINQSVELNRSSNMYYLEMQYKFQWASKSFGVISNLMKVRNESTKKAINEVR